MYGQGLCVDRAYVWTGPMYGQGLCMFRAYVWTGRMDGSSFLVDY